MEPNPQAVNYAMYVLASGAALTAATIGGAYLALQRIKQYDDKIKKLRAKTDGSRNVTRDSYYNFYKFVETHIPKEKQDSVRKSFRTELERRIGREKVREFNASIVGMI